jgi:hypothetical protein
MIRRPPSTSPQIVLLLFLLILRLRFFVSTTASLGDAREWGLLGV